MVEKLKVNKRQHDVLYCVLALKINEIIDHLPQEKVSLCVGCSRACGMGMGIVTICANREPKQPTKEVPDKIKILLTDIDDLIIQATKERSHYYVKSILERCKEEISVLYRKEK